MSFVVFRRPRRTPEGFKEWAEAYRSPSRLRTRAAQTLSWIWERIRQFGILKSATVAAAAGVIAYGLFAPRDTIYIESISLPAYIKQLGYTDEMFLEQVLGAMDNIVRETQTSHDKAVISAPRELPSFEIPSVDVSVRTILQKIQHYIGREPTTVTSTLIVHTDDFSKPDFTALELAVRVRGSDRSMPRTPPMARLTAQNMSELITQVSLRLLETTAPYIAAARALNTNDEAHAMEILDGMIASGRDLMWAHFAEANVMRERHDLEGALKHYHEAQKHNTDPSFVLVDLNLGILLAMRNEYEPCNKLFQDASQRYPKDASIQEMWAAALMFLMKHDEAVQHYEKAAGLDPASATILGEWAGALGMLGKYDEAEKRFQQAVALDADDAGLYFNWGVVYEQQNRYKDAAGKFEHAASLDPTDPKIFFDWGEALVADGRSADALIHYEEAAKLKPDWPLLYFNWGGALDNLDRLDDSIAYFRRAIELAPDRGYAHQALAAVLVEKRQFKEAEKEFELATELERTLSTYHDWGLALAGEGKYREAIVKYQSALELKPEAQTTNVGWLPNVLSRASGAEAMEYSDTHLRIGSVTTRAEVLIDMGVALAQLNRFREAIDQYEQAIRLDPKMTMAYVQKGLALASLRKFGDAVTSFEKADGQFQKADRSTLDLEKWARVLLNLAAALRDSGRPKDALRVYERAGELDPRQPDAHRLMGDTLNDLGKAKQAAVEYQKAARLFEQEAQRTPRDGDIYLAWADSLGKLSQPEKVVAVYQKAIAAGVGDPRIYLGLIDSLNEAGKSQEAFALYPKAAAAAPKEFRVYLFWAIDLVDAKKINEALPLFEKAATLNPKSSVVHAAWGHALVLDNKNIEAIAHCEKAVSLEPKYAETYNVWSAALRNLGKTEEADEKFSRYQQLLKKGK